MQILPKSSLVNKSDRQSGVEALGSNSLNASPRHLQRPPYEGTLGLLAQAGGQTALVVEFNLDSVIASGLAHELETVGDAFSRPPKPAHAVVGIFKQQTQLPPPEALPELAKEVRIQTPLSRVDFFPVEATSRYLHTVMALAAQHPAQTLL